MTSINYYPKNFHANGWGWHRSKNAASAVRGFLKGERGEGGSSEPLIGNGRLYPTLPSEDNTTYSTGSAKLYPCLSLDEYGSGEVEEVIEESCQSFNVNAVVSCLCTLLTYLLRLNAFLE